jgi:hypothetical protein
MKEKSEVKRNDDENNGGAVATLSGHYDETENDDIFYLEGEVDNENVDSYDEGSDNDSDNSDEAVDVGVQEELALRMLGH